MLVHCAMCLVITSEPLFSMSSNRPLPTSHFDPASSCIHTPPTLYLLSSMTGIIIMRAD